MRVLHVTFIALGLLAVAVALDTAYDVAHRMIYGVAPYSSEANFHVPDSSSEIILDRRGIHLFLAEYERTLVLRDNGRDLLRLEAAVDTGGCSRMNVYQISKTIFYFSGYHSSDRYLLDTSKPSVTRDFLGAQPVGAKFAGAFDRDEKGWRFIPANERAETMNPESTTEKIEGDIR